tara:strand:- start:636 stop:764 length:129 start_codon:yes stop_codon:yes gene_type:complete
LNIDGGLLEGENLDAIDSAGPRDVEAVTTEDVFSGAVGGDRT